jgi:1-acyl-sn-glycerol-3-phosphate acyltransferase
MSADSIACLTLLGYGCAGTIYVLWRALRCPEGWRLWILNSLGSIYCRVGFRWRSNRTCPFLDARPAIIIANHRSPVDPILIWAGVTNCRPVEFLTAKEYFGVPGLQFIFEAQRCIPVARNGKDMAATRTALRRIEEGRIIGVFPEGRINTGPGLLPGDPGIAWLALHARAPVYPVFIENAPRGKGMVEPFWNFRPVKVHYGEAIDLSSYYNRRRTSELLQEVTDLLMRRLAETGGLETGDTAVEAADGDRPVLPLVSPAVPA